jgi:hypothetical protein
MSNDPHQIWAKYFKSFYENNLECLGADITPLRKQGCKTLAALQAQQAVYTDQLAASRGGNADILADFLKVSSEITAQQKALGLDRPAKPPESAPGESGTDQLEKLITGIANGRQAERRAEEAAGIFRTVDGVVVSAEMLMPSLRSAPPAPALPAPELIASPAPAPASVAPKAEPQPVLLNGSNPYDMSPGPHWVRHR